MGKKEKWRRVDYWHKKKACYPYNFVRAPKSVKMVRLPGKRKEGNLSSEAFFREHPELDHGRFAPNTHTGVIEVEVTALSPLIVSHPPGSDRSLSKDEQEKSQKVLKAAQLQEKGPYGGTDIDGARDKDKQLIPSKKAEHDAKMQRIRPSFQRGPDRFILPATSLKGMLRSLVEAYSNSFMGLVSPALKGEGREGSADIRHRARWRRPSYINENNVTLYTYNYRGPKGSGNWDRWVPKAHTPWAKLEHVNPAAHEDEATLADLLFGRVGGKFALRGRVRLGDAVGWDAQGNSTVRAAGDYWFLRPLTRPSGAKAKCEALYLLPDGNGKVNPYYYENNGKPISDSEARGRKMYWPHSLGGPGDSGSRPLGWVRDRIASAASCEELWQDDELANAVGAFKKRVTGHRDAQSATKSWVNPVLPGSRFRFSLRFEHLSSVELGALLKAIELENGPARPLKEITHCHRIGRAKPLGFGTAALRITRVRLWDTAQAVRLNPGGDCWKMDAVVEAALGQARKDFAKHCAAWQNPVWEDVQALTALPDGITDRDYWKNWTDYQPWVNSDHPLPLPKEDATP
ncbi:MAG TPA: RAMP superfamily CRISPR-associated protein [Candidatus Hydrogenedentes bacterium]|nr:RAMP superfamily CRISPR-associated protein [Candidatus Hydrogenedentota bacterium]